MIEINGRMYEEVEVGRFDCGLVQDGTVIARAYGGCDEVEWYGGIEEDVIKWAESFGIETIIDRR